MKSVRTIDISALNIAMHQPHSPQRYMDLLWDARRSKKLVQLGSVHGAMIGHLSGPREYSRGTVLVGEIYRFLKIDASQPWFNVETRDVASEDDMEKVQIPKELLPNLQRIEFVFIPSKHQLWFSARDRGDRLGAATAKKLFDMLLTKIALEKGYPKIAITVIPDKESVEELLGVHRIKRLTIQLKRPNADDAADLEQKFLEQLEVVNSREMVTIFTEADKDGVKPTEELRGLANVAARNGSVRVEGKTADGVKIDESTIERPMVLQKQVDENVELALNVLVRTAQEG